MTKEEYIKLYGSAKAVSKEMSRRSTGNKGNRKYSDKVVRDIRDSDLSTTELAAKYGMHYTQVWKIKTNKIRK